MNAFREVQFPIEYSTGATGSGGGFKTIVNQDAGGYETRLIRWSVTRGQWDVSHLLKDDTEIHGLKTFFNAVAWGKGYGFRFHWRGNFCAYQPYWRESTNISNGTIDPPNLNNLPVIGIGDSTNGTDGTSVFQLLQEWNQDGYQFQKNIYKPVLDTTRIWVDGVHKQIDTHFTVDTTTGKITFTAGNNPLTGEEIRAWYEFDYPARFDIDDLEERIIKRGLRSDFPDIPIVEIKMRPS